MKNIMKKTGWTIVALLPILAFLGIQVACSVLGGLLVSVWSAVTQTVIDLGTVLIPILIASQLVASLVFGLWYYFVYGRKERPAEAEKPCVYHILLILILGVAAQFAIAAALTLVESVAPQAMEKYVEMIEQLGIAEFSALSLISTVVLAPFCEELTCRGVIYRLAGKVSPKFWVANVIQALAFGILHANLIQGTYAFLLGLILGVIYKKFHNIWLCMLLHAAMNASGLLVNPFFSLFPEKWAIAVVIVTMVLAAVLLAVCLAAILKSRGKQEKQLTA